MEDKYTDACRRYIAGETLAQIAPDLGVTIPTLLHALRRRKVEIRPRGLKRVQPFNPST